MGDSILSLSTVALRTCQHPPLPPSNAPPGEMVFPWMFEDFKALGPVRAAAELVAAEDNWPALYDAEVLRGNTVPVAAATYFEDMFVDFDLAQVGGWVGGVDRWVGRKWHPYTVTGLGNSLQGFFPHTKYGEGLDVPLVNGCNGPTLVPGLTCRAP
jgi:hypothetical protein